MTAIHTQIQSTRNLPQPTIPSILANLVTEAADDGQILQLVRAGDMDGVRAEINRVRAYDPARAAYLAGFAAIGRGELTTALTAFRDYHNQNQSQQNPTVIYNMGWMAENVFCLNQIATILNVAFTAYLIAAHLDRRFYRALEGLERLYPFFPIELHPRLWKGDVNVNIPRDSLFGALARAGAKPRYLANFDRRSQRWDNVMTLNWIQQNLLPSSSVLSVGCGVGFDLVWLFENGFGKLQGIDNHATAIAAASSLAHQLNAPIDYGVGDIMQPGHLPDFDCILSLHALAWQGPESYTRFFDLYAPHVKHGGYLIFDAFDSRDDAAPAGCRARTSEKKLAAQANQLGFCIAALFRESRAAPKTVYVFRRMRAQPLVN